jgi:hypothetical protein
VHHAVEAAQAQAREQGRAAHEAVEAAQAQAREMSRKQRKAARHAMEEAAHEFAARLEQFAA